ncbi:MAG: glycine cleavage system protein GcvH [Desulfovibrionaceae bacterium]|nr:glycine cleavage system protein GcvH [Desulfovibrionaceae bacterium]
MKELNELNLPDDRRYTAEHVWIKADGDSWLVGISDFAQDQLGEIAFVDLPSAGSEFAAGEEFGSVESLKSVNALYMPVAGTVAEANEELESTPTLVNVSAYEQGWMIRINAASPADADALLTAEQYRATLG